MSKIKNSGLDQYGAAPFEQQQFGISGIEGVNLLVICNLTLSCPVVSNGYTAKCSGSYWSNPPFLIF